MAISKLSKPKNNQKKLRLFKHGFKTLAEKYAEDYRKRLSVETFEPLPYLDLANYLRHPKNKSYRTLAYIDPCGMQVEWRSIECLRGLLMDTWILVPTGLGVNRLLKNNLKFSIQCKEKRHLTNINEIFLPFSPVRKFEKKN